MVRSLFFAALVSLSWPSLAAAQGALPADTLASRLAYFSPQRAFALSPDGKAAEAKLSALEAERGKELAARNAKVLRPALDAVAKERNLLFVINEETLLAWANPTLDITADVVKRLGQP